MATSYLTVAEFEAKVTTDLAEDLTDLDGSDLTTEEENLIQQAEALVNGFIEVVQTVPVTATEAVRVLARLTFSVAQYYLYQYMRGDSVPERVRVEYTDALKMLERIRDGVVILPGSSATRQSGSFTTLSDTARFNWDDADIAKDTY